MLKKISHDLHELVRSFCCEQKMFVMYFKAIKHCFLKRIIFFKKYLLCLKVAAF